MTKPEKIAAYIESHGFDTETDGPFVSFKIPLTKNGKPAGYAFRIVTTLKGAREALGY